MALWGQGPGDREVPECIRGGGGGAGAGAGSCWGGDIAWLWPKGNGGGVFPGVTPSPGAPNLIWDLNVNKSSRD